MRPLRSVDHCSFPPLRLGILQASCYRQSHAIEKSQKFTATVRKDDDLQQHVPPVTVCLPQAED